MRAPLMRSARGLAFLGVLLLALGACGSRGQSVPQGTGRGATVRLYGADGNMSNSFGNAFRKHAGALATMKGTTPLSPLTEDFKNRLRGVDAQLADYNYAGESYDAVVITAIAAELARTVDATAFARYVVGVTVGGTVCETVADCLDLARAGKDLQYRGVSLRHSGLTDLGEPSSATYGILHFNRANQVDSTRTEYVNAGDEKNQGRAESPRPRSTRGTGPLRIGALLPRTGRLAIMGPPMFAGIRLAINDINDARGVLGVDVAYVEGDDGTSAAVAQAAADRLIASGVQAIIGAAASGITKAVLPKVVAAGRLLFSPASTADELSRLDSGGLFFRTAPPDTLQAKALTDIIMRDGPRRLAIVTIDDAYGSGLGDNVEADLVLDGIPTGAIRRFKYPVKDSYDPPRDSLVIFDPLARELKSFNPDAVVVIGSDESAEVIQSLIGQDVLPVGD